MAHVQRPPHYDQVHRQAWPESVYVLETPLLYSATRFQRAKRNLDHPSHAIIFDHVTHLLGVVDNVLIASGARLYWIGLQGAEAGGILSRWPESSDAVGRGRGIVAGNAVYWPTRRGILVFDASKRTMIREYPLAQLGIESGNLTCLNGLTFITGGRSLTAFAENDQDPGREVERTPAEETPRNEFEENAGPLTYRQPNYRRN